MENTSPNSPKFSLVGAGPGDSDLLTIKGAKVLALADVVLYDSLANEEILDFAPNALKIYVGKRVGCHAYTQDQINELIVANAFEHGHVVRLKGGDPFVFGRGKEEQEFAESFGIPTEIIPGVSSCISVPAAAGIPVTSRGVAESFWVITGTTSSGDLSKDIPLAAKSTATVVILMGLAKLSEIVTIYRNLGKANMPTGIIQNGTSEGQKEVFGTLDTILELVEKEGISSPAVIVIGDVVQFASKKLTDEAVFELEDEFIFQNLNQLPFMN